MKKWLVGIPLTALLAFADAGSLRYSPEFFKQLWANSGSNEIACSSDLTFSKEQDYLCAKTIYRPDLFMTVWDSISKSIAKDLKQDIQTTAWTEINKYTLYRTSFKLNSVPIVIFVYQNLDEPYTTKLLIAANTGSYKIDTSANPLSLRAVAAQPALISQTILAMQRYRCEPSENGRARVFGTIKNTSTRTLEFLRFNVEFFDGSKFVGQDSGFIRADKLAPNNESTFEGLARVSTYTRCELSFEDSTGKLPFQLP